MDELTLDDVRMKKALLDTEIAKLLLGFTRDTGLSVSGMELKAIQELVIGDSYVVAAYQVNSQVLLG